RTCGLLPVHPPRKGSQAADGSGLENRQGRKLLVGSNPTPSANDHRPLRGHYRGRLVFRDVRGRGPVRRRTSASSGAAAGTVPGSTHGSRMGGRFRARRTAPTLTYCSEAGWSVSPTSGRNLLAHSSLVGRVAEIRPTSGPCSVRAAEPAHRRQRLRRGPSDRGEKDPWHRPFRNGTPRWDWSFAPAHRPNQSPRPEGPFLGLVFVVRLRNEPWDEDTAR